MWFFQDCGSHFADILLTFLQKKKRTEDFKIIQEFWSEKKMTSLIVSAAVEL